MRAITLGAGIVIALGIFSAAPTAHAPTLDLDSCHDDLDRLRRAASDSSDAAADADSKRKDFEDCKRDPGTYDLMGDGCHGRQSDYQSALSDLGSKMDDLDSRLQSVQNSADMSSPLTDCRHWMLLNATNRPRSAACVLPSKDSLVWACLPKACCRCVRRTWTCSGAKRASV